MIANKSRPPFYSSQKQNADKYSIREALSRMYKLVEVSSQVLRVWCPCILFRRQQEFL